MVQFQLSGCRGHDIKAPVISPYKHFEAIFLLRVRVQSVGLLHIISPLICQAPLVPMKFKEYARVQCTCTQASLANFYYTVNSND